MLVQHMCAHPDCHCTLFLLLSLLQEFGKCTADACVTDLKASCMLLPRYVSQNDIIDVDHRSTACLLDALACLNTQSQVPVLPKVLFRASSAETSPFV